jgi:hypothetical protein
LKKKQISKKHHFTLYFFFTKFLRGQKRQEKQMKCPFEKLNVSIGINFSRNNFYSHYSR